MILNIIFFVTMYPVLFIMFFVYKYMSKAEDGVLFGVKIRKEWLKEAAVEDIVRYFNRAMRITFVVLLLLPLTALLTKHFSIQFTIWMFWLLLVIVVMAFPYAKANLRLKDWKRSCVSSEQMEEDEDNQWYWGMFYYNPKDKTTMVNKRFGIGTTMNMATKAGKILLGVSIFSLAIIPACCIWVIALEFTPMDLLIQNDMLVAKQIKVDYQIPIAEMEDVKLITELPHWTKVTGSGMDNLEKGTFDIRNQGKCEVFLKPHNNEFIQFTYQGKEYYMSDFDDTQTLEIYNAICEK